MDLSLDEIIKKNRAKRGGHQISRGRSNNTRDGAGRNNNAPGRTNNRRQNNNGRVQNTGRRPHQAGGRPVVDARMKIIQNNRMRFTDARDKLADLAKQTDARTKIKGRSIINSGAQVNRRQERRQPNRVNMQQHVQQQPVVLQRSIWNNSTNRRGGFVNANHSAPNNGMDSNLMRRTINRSFQGHAGASYADEDHYSSPLPPRDNGSISNIKVVTQNESYYPQEYIPQPAEPMYVDHSPPVYQRPFEAPRTQQPSVRSGSGGARMSQEMRNRLDNPRSAPFTYPASPPSPPPPSQGHRIVVSNLHSSVTHEDIKELFEDIGPLYTSRLVRAGTAEVVYKHLSDAKRAVELYHNRQLDRQPMKCLLVNPRSPVGSCGILRSSGVLSAPKFPSSSKSMVVPDLTAIHKALFTSSK